MRAAEASGTVPIIRPPRNEPDVIGAYMDCGARGIQAPHIHSAKEAQQVVDAVLYGPEGRRSLAVGTRSARYGFASGMERYTQESNQDMLVCVQVEDREGLSQLKDIAAVPRVDVVFIGPSDLSQSLGHPGDPGHPEVKAWSMAALTSGRSWSSGGECCHRPGFPGYPGAGETGWHRVLSGYGGHPAGPGRYLFLHPSPDAAFRIVPNIISSSVIPLFLVGLRIPS